MVPVEFDRLSFVKTKFSILGWKVTYWLLVEKLLNRRRNVGPRVIRASVPFCFVLYLINYISESLIGWRTKILESDYLGTKWCLLWAYKTIGPSWNYVRPLSTTHILLLKILIVPKYNAIMITVTMNKQIFSEILVSWIIIYK